MHVFIYIYICLHIYVCVEICVSMYIAIYNVCVYIYSLCDKSYQILHREESIHNKTVTM